MKGCGKTTVGKILAEKLHAKFVDSDTEIEKVHRMNKNEILSFREIFKKYGESYFNTLDIQTLQNIFGEFNNTDFVFASAGRTPLQEENQDILQRLGVIIFLNVERNVLLKRILKDGIPAFFPYPDDPGKSLDELLKKRSSTYRKLANLTIDITSETPTEITDKIIRSLK